MRHRVLNHLNLIYNLLYFQRQFGGEESAAAQMESMQKRVKAVALAYEHFARPGEFDRVGLAGYLRSLAREAGQAGARAKPAIACKTRLAPVFVGLTPAIHCGLIVAELLDHCLKHAFRGRRRGEIAVALRQKRDGTLALTVGVNGVAMPPAVRWQRSESMGSFLVNTLTESLGGELTVAAGRGTAFQLRFRPAPGPAAHGPGSRSGSGNGKGVAK